MYSSNILELGLFLEGEGLFEAHESPASPPMIDQGPEEYFVVASEPDVSPSVECLAECVAARVERQYILPAISIREFYFNCFYKICCIRFLFFIFLILVFFSFFFSF